MIRHLEVDIRHSRFWSLEITEVPGQALLKSPRVLVGAWLHPLSLAGVGAVAARRRGMIHQESTGWWGSSEKPVRPGLVPLEMVSYGADALSQGRVVPKLDKSVTF